MFGNSLFFNNTKILSRVNVREQTTNIASRIFLTSLACTILMTALSLLMYSDFVMRNADQWWYFRSIYHIEEASYAE